jgi:hypothetical protein
MEPTSLPQRPSESPEWLVAARDKIGRELLRIRESLEALSQVEQSLQKSQDEERLNMLLGAAFSLWRTVSQAGHRDDEAGLDAAREFVDDVVADSATIHGAELTPWLFGYYLSDARLRLLQMAELCKEWRLGGKFFKSYRLIAISPPQPAFTPECWEQCLAVLQNLLSSYESRAATGQTTAHPRRERATVVGDTDGTYAILQSDGAAASFVNGKWRPGIAFDSRDFLDMRTISQPQCVSILLEMAAEALAKSLEE